MAATTREARTVKFTVRRLSRLMSAFERTLKQHLVSYRLDETFPTATWLKCAGTWRRGVVVSGVRRMNEVNPRRARLVLGLVTVSGLVYHLDMQPAN